MVRYKPDHLFVVVQGGSANEKWSQVTNCEATNGIAGVLSKRLRSNEEDRWQKPKDSSVL